jgi:hypothetical protein
LGFRAVCQAIRLRLYNDQNRFETMDNVKYFSAFGKNTLVVGEMSFNLYANPTNVKRVDYQIDFVEKKFVGEGEDRKLSDDFCISRTWPLFLEHNIGKIPTDMQDNLISKLINISNAHQNKKDLNIQVEKSENEQLIAKFEVKLLVGKNMFIFQGTPYLVNISPQEAISYILPASYGIALITTSEKIAKQLMFFLNYGLHKWNKTGGPKAISAFEQTWDFSNVQGMVDEFMRAKLH